MNPVEWSTEERQRTAHVLRLGGMTWAQIAAHNVNGEPLYADASGAWRGAKAYRDAHLFGDDLMEQRAIDMERFDALQKAMWAAAMDGDLDAAKFVVTVMTARQKMLGVQNIQATVSTVDPLDELAKKRNAS